jgi:DNA-3-methyladenine glycosylase I
MARRRQAIELFRCPWAKGEQYTQYHDTEWEVPVHDDRVLFEFLILEGAQAGLSWATILKKRDNYREAFNQFDPAIIAKYGRKKQTSLLGNAGIDRPALYDSTGVNTSNCSKNLVQFAISPDSPICTRS